MRGHRRNSEAGRLKCVSLLSVLFLLVKAAEAFWYSVRVIFLDLLTYGTEMPDPRSNPMPITLDAAHAT
jgi:hypothetical protein